jgi:hypothetical protein
MTPAHALAAIDHGRKTDRGRRAEANSSAVSRQMKKRADDDSHLKIPAG